MTAKRAHPLARFLLEQGSALPLKPPRLFLPALLKAIRSQYQLDWDGIHGVRHWARVMENGLLLASLTGARQDVLALFALLHDACRLTDTHDPAHGRRAADLAVRWRGQCFNLDDPGLQSLVEACRHHTAGRLDAELTVQTCWDADRLDLLRVGASPDPRRLGLRAARDRRLIAWANQRAVADAFPFQDEFLAADLPQGDPGPAPASASNRDRS
jgi:uncharacterized protein